VRNRRKGNRESRKKYANWAALPSTSWFLTRFHTFAARSGNCIHVSWFPFHLQRLHFEVSA
jgi:hypothetical protein